MELNFTPFRQSFTVGLFMFLAFICKTKAQSPLQDSNPMNYSMLTASSSSSSSSSCITAPVIICPSIYFGCPSDDTSTANTGSATATPGDENCDIPIVTYSDEIISTGPCQGATEIHRTWSANYPNNSNPFLYAHCTQLILLSDNNGPTISNCPSNITVLPNEDCEALVSWAIPTADDNCGLASFNSNYDNGSLFPMGTTTVTYTAIDLCGNENTCSFVVKVEGSCCFDEPIIQAPEDIVSCPGTDFHPDNIGYATALPGSDDCATPIVSFSDNTTFVGQCDGQMTIHRTWTASYPDNIPSLSATAVQVITLTDNKDPIITNVPTDITLAPNADCNAVANWTEPNATDNCGIASFTSNYPSGHAFSEGSTTVTYTATDHCGNHATVSFNVTVTACCALPPTINCPTDYNACPNSSYGMDVTGSATATASPNCGTPIVSFTDQIISSGPCTGAKVVNRTWTATDPDNDQLVSTCTQVITLADGTNPTIANAPASITLTPNADCNAVATWTEPNATDNCGIASFTSNYPSGHAFSEGTTVVTYTATDHCGNDATVSFNVTVTACCVLPPTINCPTDFSACPNSSYGMDVTGSATATASPNCGIPIVSFTDQIISTGPCTGAKVVNRTWTATDPDNDQLVSTCTQVITLADESNPVISNVPTNITLAPDAECNAVVTWTEPNATDNCGIATFTSNYPSGHVFSEGNTLVTYTATDYCGNHATGSFNVTITACCTLPPTINCPTDFFACPSSSYETNATGTATATASPNCGIPIVSFTDQIISTGPCTGAKVVNRTWTATDPDNDQLVSTCTQVITLADDTSPVIENCPTNITVTTPYDSIAVSWTPPTSYDNCGLEWLMGDYSPGDLFPIGQTTVTYISIDDCENIEVCTFVITVENSGNFVCPDDITINCDSADGAVVNWTPPVLESDCQSCQSGDSIPGFIYMGTLNGSSYYCSTTQTNNHSAEMITAAYGGYLATITSEAENSLLKSFIGSQCASIGLTDVNTEGSFYWKNGEQVTYTDWANDQPNNVNNDQNCTVLCADGWYDDYCNAPREFIMELPCTQYTQISGLPAGSVFPIGIDTITYQVTDECGDTYECSFTVTVESSLYLECNEDINILCQSNQSGSYVSWDVPNIITCCDSCEDSQDSIAGFMYMGFYNGSKYYCSLEPQTWPNAKINSINRGGYLAKVDDAGENQFLANLLTLQRAWIGLSDDGYEGSFRWTDDTPLTYQNWYPNQPNNKNNYQDYVAMLSDGLWNDEYNNLLLEYIMEVPCTSITQINGPENGSWHPVGTSTVTYVGQDGCGGIDTCSFDITVSPNANCPSFGLDTWYMWINSIGLGNYTNISGNNGGYEDFTNDQCIDVQSGASYPITLGPGFSSGHYAVFWKVWIDYNQDGDYFDANEFVAYGTGNTTLNGTLPILNNCLTGSTTMRVTMKYGSYPSGPCAVYQHGETEDYCINIGHQIKSDDSVDSRYNKVIELDQASDNNMVSMGKTELSDKIVESNTENLKFKIYPNPVHSTFTISTNSKSVDHFILLDQHGKVVLEYELDPLKGSNFIDVSKLHNGVYMLISKDRNYQQKIVIQH